MAIKFATVTIEDVRRSGGGAVTLYLSKADEKGWPRWLVIKAPPRKIESVIGTRIKVTNDTVYIGETLWARRVDHYLTLVEKAKRKP